MHGSLLTATQGMAAHAAARCVCGMMVLSNIAKNVLSNIAKSASVQRGALDGRTADDGYLPRLASSMTIVPCLDTLPWAGTPSWTKNDAVWLTTGIYHATHPV